MAFFEQLGKKISDAGQGVAQSSRNAMDIAKLNSAINDKKRQIGQYTAALGEQYYQLHKDTPDEALAQLVNAITALYGEIHDCEEQIKNIRGVVKCPNCGADVPLNASFCAVCGTPAATAEKTVAPATPPEGTRECPYCHKFVPQENKFCTFCGSKLED